MIVKIKRKTIKYEGVFGAAYKTIVYKSFLGGLYKKQLYCYYNAVRRIVIPGIEYGFLAAKTGFTKTEYKRITLQKPF